MIKPSYDLSNLKTNHEIILFVRDQILEKMDLRIRLYPSFAKYANRCESREDLLALVKKTILKAGELAKEIGTTKKVRPKEKAKISAAKKKSKGDLFFCEQCQKNVSHVKENQAAYCTECSYLLNWREIQSASEINLDCRQCNKMIEGVLYHIRDLEKDEVTGYQISGNCKQCNLKTEINPSIEIKKSVQPKRLDKFSTDSSTLSYTHTPSPPPPPSYQKGNTDFDNVSQCLSVWEKICRHKPDVEEPEQTARVAYYSKYKDIIKQVIDKFQVLTATDGVAKAKEQKIIFSYKVLDKLLNDLYTDSFLELEVIPCGLRNPAMVYSTARCTTERHARYTKRLREANGTTKKVRPKENPSNQKGNAVDKVLAHNEAVRKGTIKLKEKQGPSKEERDQEYKELTQKTMNGQQLDPKQQVQFDEALKTIRRTYDKEIKNGADEKKARDLFVESRKQLHQSLVKGEFKHA